MPKRIFSKKAKNIPGWGYWGDEDEIEIGISSGVVNSQDEFKADKLHYHQKGVVYIIVLDGSGLIEIDGENFEIQKGEVLRIQPGEKYRHLGVKTVPFSWITICTVKDAADKVVIE